MQDVETKARITKLFADIRIALEQAIEMRSRQGQETWTYHELIKRIEAEEDERVS